MVNGGRGSINSFSINAGAINGAGRNGRQEAFADIVTITLISSSAIYNAKPIATPTGSTEITCLFNIKHAGRVAIVTNGEVTCFVPKIRHASSVISLSITGINISPLITRLCASPVSSRCDILSGCFSIRAGGVSVGVHGDVGARATHISFPAINISAIGLVAAMALRTAMVLSAISCTSSVNANGGYVIAGSSNLGVHSNTQASAGYGVPSLSVISGVGNVFARAVQRIASSSSVVCRSLKTCDAIAAFGGVSIINCKCATTCSAIAEQGQCDNFSGIVIVGASCEYWFVSSADIVTRSIELNINPSVVHISKLDIIPMSKLRVECKINNLLEGYVYKDASSKLNINVNGVAVAYIVGHIHATTEIQSVAEYWHMCAVNLVCDSSSSCLGTTVMNCDAQVDAGSNGLASGHCIWSDALNVDCDVTASVYANVFYELSTERIESAGCMADLALRPTFITSTASAFNCTTTINSYCDIARLCGCNIDCISSIVVYAIGNILASDSIERTMFRPYSNREMFRQYTDREMKTQPV